MNRSRHAILVPLFAVLALLCCLTENASAAFNHAATEPHYGNFLLRESEVSTSEWLQLADPIKENGEWIYDGALGVPVYVRQNPWTMFDQLGLEAAQDDFIGQVMDKVNHIADSLFHASRDPGGAMASGVDKVINGAVGSPMTGPQEPLKSAAVYQEGSHADKGGDFMVAYAAVVGAAMEGPGLFKGRGPKTINQAWPKSLETTSVTKSASQIVEENKVRIRHATSNEGANKIIEEKKIDSSSKYVYGQETTDSGSTPTKKELLDTGAASADKVIEFDAKPSEYRKNEVGDVEIPKPVDLTDRNPQVIEVKE